MNTGKQKVNLLVLLDLSAAFDAIDHKALLEISKTDLATQRNGFGPFSLVALSMLSSTRTALKVSI